MRELVFKNITSLDRRRKITYTSEINEKDGLRSIIHRHFIYVIKEEDAENIPEIKNLSPILYILREHNKKEQREKFLCRIKGIFYVINNGRLFSIFYRHSLKISLIALT